MTTQTTLNGLNAADLKDAITGVEHDPGLGKYTFRAVNKWVDGAHCSTAIKDFKAAGQEDTSRSQPHLLHADEPTCLLGTDSGPNATEALLHALASCLNAAFIYHATAQGVKIDELEFQLEGNLDINGFLGIDESVRNGFESIQITCRVKSDAPVEKLQELCEYAQKRSPVFDIVTHETPVTVRLEL
ncbi:MAG TPA: OsmC family peroxiredoxin [Phycisphaerales bacterium]|nr:OsmC family peroxiredoxin [Phycisphaerales bacterium]